MNTNRLLICLADECGIDVTSLDVREAAHVADYLTKGIGTIPGDRPGANSAGTGPADSMSFGVVGDLVILSHCRQYFVEEKASVVVAYPVVLVTAIATRLRIRRSCWHFAW